MNEPTRRADDAPLPVLVELPTHDGSMPQEFDDWASQLVAEAESKSQSQLEWEIVETLQKAWKLGMSTRTHPIGDSAIDPVDGAPHFPSTREEASSSSASSDGRAAALDAAPQLQKDESRSPDGDGQEKSHIGSTARGEPKGVGRISAAADSSHEPTTRDGNRAELTRQFGTNDDACDDRIAKDVAGSEPADSLTLLAEQQITARLEQIHQKLLHAEALTVGDGVFLFDLLRTLRSDGEAVSRPRSETFSALFAEAAEDIRLRVSAGVRLGVPEREIEASLRELLAKYVAEALASNDPK